MADTKAGYQVTALPGAEEIGNFEHSYLVCHLDDRLFGIPTTEVQEIVPLPQLMKLPQLPNCMLGLARYREEIIPVLNLRTISAMGDSVTHESEQMIVINHGRRLCGVALHDISEILNFSSEDIEPMPSITACENDHFYVGIKRMGNELVTLLDVGSVLDFAEIPTRLDSSGNQTGVDAAAAERVGVVRLGDIRVGIDIRQIDRIIRVPDIQALEENQPHIKGIALREGVDRNNAEESDYYSIVDLFKVMNAPEDNGKKSLILSSASGVTVGFYAGQVDTIMDIPEAALTSLPDLVRTAANSYVKRIIKTCEDLVLLLDLADILHSSNLPED